MKIQVVRMEIKKDYIEINNITDKQLNYINAIEEYKATHKEIPSLRKICKLLECRENASTVFDMMNRLYKKGYDYRKM